MILLSMILPFFFPLAHPCLSVKSVGQLTVSLFLEAGGEPGGGASFPVEGMGLAKMDEGAGVALVAFIDGRRGLAIDE